MDGMEDVEGDGRSGGVSKESSLIISPKLVLENHLETYRT